MRYKYMISIVYIFGTLSLYAEKSALSDILQKVGEKEALIKPIEKKKRSKKQSHFVFVDKYDGNSMAPKEKSESYDYDNKSKFKFKFNDGSAQSNFLGQRGAASMGGSSSGGAGKGRR